MESYAWGAKTARCYFSNESRKNSLAHYMRQTLPFHLRLKCLKREENFMEATNSLLIIAMIWKCKLVWRRFVCINFFEGITSEINIFNFPLSTQQLYPSSSCPKNFLPTTLGLIRLQTVNLTVKTRNIFVE